MSSLLDAIDGFAGLRVLVVGDLLLDVYLAGDASRLCREAPVPVVRVQHRDDVPGGAGNAATNLAALGADVCLLGVVGSDREGRRLRDGLEQAGMTCADVVVDPTRETLSLHRLMASSQLLVRFDAGSTDPATAHAEVALVDRLRARWDDADAVVVSDYEYGTLTPGLLDAIAAEQRRRPRVLVVDSKRVAAFRHLRPTAVKPNWSEARQLLLGRVEESADRAAALRAHGEDILELTGARIAAVTLDRAGAIVFERGLPPLRTYAEPRPTSLATGAGDTFVAALTLALATGAATSAAAELASAAANVVVAKNGTATCDRGELRLAVSGREKLLGGPAELAAVVDRHRRHGRRVVFTNGCFDILHRGHTAYLKRAKALGDVLVVAVNDDASVASLKGPHRPINPLEDRLRVLAALSCVDHLVVFDGSSPTGLIEAARPDVFAKGADYTLDTLPEADLVASLGGEVALLPLEPDRSTTLILERARGAASTTPA